MSNAATIPAGRPNLAVAVILCLGVAMLEGVDIQAIGAVAPRLGKALHLSREALGPVFSASTFGLLIGAAGGGRLADRIGARGVLTASVALFGLFSLATAWAWDAGSLFGARFATGLGIGGALPNIVALVSGSVRPERRGAAVAGVYAGMPFGGAVASGLTLVGSPDEWRHVFLFGGLVPIILAPLLWLLLPRRVAASGRPGDQAPMTPILQVLFGGGRAIATGLLWISFFLTLVILYLLLNWLPTLMTTRGYAPSVVGELQLVFNLTGSIACLLMGGMLDGRWRAPFMVAVYLVLGASLFALGALTAAPVVEIALGGVLGAAVLLAQAVLYDAAPRLYPPAVRGAGVGWAVAMGRTGSVVGPLLGGLLVAQAGSPAEVLMRLTPVVGAGAVTTLLLIWRGGLAARQAHANHGENIR